MLKDLIRVGVISLGLCSSGLSFAYGLDLPMSLNQTKTIFQEDWTKRINLSGLLMGELILSNYNQSASGRFSDKRSYQTFCFPRANLNVDAEINDWSKVHMTFNFRSSCGYGGKNDEWAFANFGTTSESYVDLGNAEVANYTGRIGFQYLPYGAYTRNTIPASLSQLLTQSQVAGASGFAKLSENFDLAAFIFSGKKKRNDSIKIRNFGAQVFGDFALYTAKIKATVGYMYNIAGGVNFLYYESSSSTANALQNGYRKRVPGLSATIDAEFLDDWSINFRYTGAFERFDALDVSWSNHGAKPKAFVFGGAKELEVKMFDSELNSRIAASYQISKEAVNVRGIGLGRGLPKRRLQLGYILELNKYFETGIHFISDKDYVVSEGGTNRSSFTTLLSMSLNVA